MSSIYKEEILDHYKYPHNLGVMINPTLKAKEENLSCGDSVAIFLKIEKSRIKDVKFQGKGCVISQAAASILTDHIKDKSIKNVQKTSLKDLMELLKIDLSPTRMKCAELSLVALKKALQS